MTASRSRIEEGRREECAEVVGGEGGRSSDSREIRNRDSAVI